MDDTTTTAQQGAITATGDVTGDVTGDAAGEAALAGDVGDDLLDDELLVEEISIDGMCGVY